MNTHKGYYSLIQYCPDPSRAESVNVGVLLFCPDLRFVGTKTAKDFKRAQQFFRFETVDSSWIKESTRSMEQRLNTERDRFRTIEDLEKFVKSRANCIVLTDPRGMVVSEPEREIEELFEELVLVPTVRRDTVQTFPNLVRIFDKPSISPRILRDQKIDIPNVNLQMEIPFIYRNGVVNLVKPQRFMPKAGGIHKAMQLAFEGELLQGYPDESGEDRKLVVYVSLEGNDTERYEQEIKNIFNMKDIRTVTDANLPDFEREVEAMAH